MGSFVPFGGFFSTPSEFKNPVSCTNASSSSLLTRCDTCNESCEQEVADILKVGPAATSTSVYSSTSLPRLQKVNVDSDRGLDVAKVCVMIHLILFSLVHCMQTHSHAHTHTCSILRAIAVLVLLTH